MLTRRDWLAATLPAAALAQPTAPPNIVVFMTDQESALLPGPASLPHRQSLLQNGIQFRHAFCNTPQCSPARAALLTGLEPHRAGVLTNIDTGSLGRTLDPSIPTLAHVLKKAGYETAYFGKWHLSSTNQGIRDYGFDSYQNGSDSAMAASAAAWMRGRKAPFLAWISLLDPHHIYDIPKRLTSVKPRPGVRPPLSGLENLDGKPAEQREFVDKDQGRQTRNFSREDWLRYRSLYLELVEKTDNLLGTVRDGIANPASTCFAYTSDHGDALGEHGLSYKGPFMYEELLRIPFLLSGAGLKRRLRHDLVRQTDLAPTLAALAGVRWPSRTDGRNLLQDTKGPDAVLLEYYSKQKWVNPIRTIRTRRWKLNWYDRGAKELYDLERDPAERINLAGRSSHTAIQATLEARIRSWRAPLT